MSWDIFVQDLPRDARTIEDIPEDFKPKPIGRRDEVTSGILRVVPNAKIEDGVIVIDEPDYSMDIFMGEGDEIEGLMIAVSGGGLAAGVVCDILRELNLSALDSDSGGIFDPEAATESFARWRAYRDQVVAE